MEEASGRRNVLVHSLWPNATEELARGWCATRRPKGVVPRSEVTWTLTSLEALKTDVPELVQLKDAESWHSRIESGLRAGLTLGAGPENMPSRGGIT